jgi:uncharacterized glyoxalase superfamily protein PhnB
MKIADTASIFIASVPPLAYILKDSLCIGKTNISLVHLNTGRNLLKFMKNNYNDLLYELDLESGSNPSMMVRLTFHCNRIQKLKANGLFEKLSAGGTVEMPLAKMFWGGWFASFRDKYGVQWMINAEDK